MKKMFKLGAAFLTAAVVSSQALAESIVMDGSTTVGPIAKAFAEYFMQRNPGINVTVGESGSGNGARSLLNQTAHIGTMSRFMRDTEFKAAVDGGVMPVAHVVALDGLPILVHPSNPVSDLTVDQVRDIYAGRITNWRQVGGPNRTIIAISRDTNSGTYETFNNMVMRRTEIASGVEYVGSNGAVRQRIQTTPAAIGYAGLGFVDETVKALKIEGVEPSEKTVRTGEYAIARPLYMFTDGYPKLGSPLFRFMNIHLSENGYYMIREVGFIPLTEY